MSQRIVAFIFARGGSKGLPQKNIFPLAGKPLIVHSIDIALSIPAISSVVVSTDDEQIAKLALDAGARVPFIRPRTLATDDAPEWSAWQHAIGQLRAAGERVDIFLSLPPTAPLRSPDDIDCCLKLLSSSAADIVITVREAERNPYFNMVRQADDGDIYLAIESDCYRRQDAPVLYDITTVAYVANADFVMQSSRIFDGRVRAVLVPRERALDIDTHLDMTIAEILISNLNNFGNARPL